MKQYSIVGNKKKVTMETNATHLKVVGTGCVIIVKSNQGHIEAIGSDCKIIVKSNQGHIQVIGSDCNINVVDNYGTINVVGSCATVTISKRYKNDDVQLIGASGQLLVDGKEKSTFEPFSAQLSPFSKNLDEVIESIFTFVMR